MTVSRQSKHMLAYLAVYFGITYLFTLAMGYQQATTHGGLPSGKTAGSDSDVCSILAVSAVCLQAFVCLVALQGTIWFPAAALFLAFTLLCHHTIVHWRSRFEGETCSCAPFQLKDISNHETWVVAALVAALVSLLKI